jgi:hypothetical protein
MSGDHISMHINALTPHIHIRSPYQISNKFISYICNDDAIKKFSIYNKIIKYINKEDSHFDGPIFKINAPKQFIINVYKEFVPECKIFKFAAIICLFILTILLDN